MIKEIQIETTTSVGEDVEKMDALLEGISISIAIRENRKKLPKT